MKKVAECGTTKTYQPGLRPFGFHPSHTVGSAEPRDEDDKSRNSGFALPIFVSSRCYYFVMSYNGQRYTINNLPTVFYLNSEDITSFCFSVSKSNPLDTQAPSGVTITLWDEFFTTALDSQASTQVAFGFQTLIDYDTTGLGLDLNSFYGLQIEVVFPDGSKVKEKRKAKVV